MHNNSSQQPRHLALHYALAMFCLLFLLWAMWVTAWDGLASFLSRATPKDAAGLSLVDRAIQLNPFYSHPYNLRAMYLLDAGRVVEAARNLESAIILSPHDYLLWLRLGDVRERLGDQQGAVAAYREAVRLAPSYATSHWYLGRLLLNVGNGEEAFPELRRAAAVNPHFYPYIVDYAWHRFGGETESVRRAAQPNSRAEQITLARFFLEHAKLSEAMALYRSAGDLSQDERKTIVATLLKIKAYDQAYEVWANGRGITIKSRPTALANGGFESDIDPNEKGFDWQVNRIEKVRVARDPREPESGGFSLRADFDGDSSPSTNLLSQILLVEPRAYYEMTFAARTQDLVTGGLPKIVVSDANDGRLLGQSKLSGEKTTGWQRYSLPFSTADNTSAVVITIQREPCSSSPCPAFGHVWFDSVACQRR